MNLDSAEIADDSGVLVISARREGHGPLVLRITSSRRDDPETSQVTTSPAEAEAIVRRWLNAFDNQSRLLG